MTRRTQTTGNSGERLARSRLELLGYRTLDTNWRCQDGEVDIVMDDQGVLVFVEVKTRIGESAGRAEDAIDNVKAERLIACAEWYLAGHDEYADAIWRVDLVAITIDGRGAVERVSHIENAVEGY